MKLYVSLFLILNFSCASALAKDIDGWGKAKFGMSMDQVKKTITGFNEYGGIGLQRNLNKAILTNSDMVTLGGIVNYKKENFDSVNFDFGISTGKLRGISLVSFRTRGKDAVDTTKKSCLAYADKLTKKYGKPQEIRENNILSRQLRLVYKLDNSVIELKNKSEDIALMLTADSCVVSFKETGISDEESVNWVHISASDNSQTFINSKSIRRNGGFSQAWFLMNFNSNQSDSSGNKYISQIVVKKFNCIEKTYIASYQAKFVAQNAQGELVDSSVLSGEFWLDVNAGSVGMRLLEVTCQ